MPSVIAYIRHGNYLPEEYSKRAFELYDTYRPLEADPLIPYAERAEKMREWWIRHYYLLVEYCLSKGIFTDVVRTNTMHFREGTLELIDLLHENNIPLVIFSAGLGDLISGFLEKDGRLYDNIHIVSNYFEFDEDGFAIGPVEPIIHSMNKGAIGMRAFPFYEKIAERKNVILLGDNLGDSEMVNGFEYENLLKIGFLNSDTDSNLPYYTEAFDLVITDDGEMHHVKDVVNEMLR
jgi:5'-nucleotidase